MRRARRWPEEAHATAGLGSRGAGARRRGPADVGRGRRRGVARRSGGRRRGGAAKARAEGEAAGWHGVMGRGGLPRAQAGRRGSGDVGARPGQVAARDWSVAVADNVRLRPDVSGSDGGDIFRVWTGEIRIFEEGSLYRHRRS